MMFQKERNLSFSSKQVDRNICILVGLCYVIDVELMYVFVSQNVRNRFNIILLDIIESNCHILNPFC